MTSEIGGGDTYILSVDPNSDGITILSGTGPAGPAGAPGEPGPEGPAFQGNAIALINPATGEAYLPGEALLVTGSLDVDVTIPPIDVEFPDVIQANVVNWPASTLVTVDNDDPIEVTIAGGVSQFDGQLMQAGEAVSATNRLVVDAVFATPQAVTVPSGVTVSGTVSLPSGTVIKSITDPVGVNILSGGSTFDGQLSQGGNPVSSTNRLPVDLGEVTLTVQGTGPSGGLVINGLMSSAVKSHVYQGVEFDGTPVSSADGLYVQPQDGKSWRVHSAPEQPLGVSISAPIALVSGSSVGLELAGNPVSASNRLPVDVSFPSLLETNVRQGGTMVGEGNPLFIQPPSNAVFTVQLAHNGFGTNTLGVNIAGTPEVTISGTPTVAVTREFTNLPVIGTVTINSNTTPVALASIAGKAVDVVNHTSTDVEYRLGGTGAYMVLAAKSADMIYPITNANQISFRLRAAGSPLDLSFKVYS